MNNITIAGNLGRDAILNQVNTTNGPLAVLNFAVPSSKKTAQGEKTTWFDCALFGKRAEGLAPYMLKGVPITVAGECELEHFQRQDGTAGAKIKVRANDVKLQGHAPAQQNGGQQQGAVNNQQQGGFGGQRAANPQQSQGGQQQGGFGGQQQRGPNTQAQNPVNNFDDFDDDIPF